MRNSGSIFPSITRGGKTVYKVEVSVGRRVDGTRRRVRRTAHSKSEANKLLATLLAQAHQGALAEGPSEKLDSFAQWWFHTIKAHQVRPATLGDYQDRYRRTVSPLLGNKKLCDVSSRDIANWMKHLSTSGASTATVNGARQVLSMLLKAAEEYGHIEKNPAKFVSRHKKSFGEHTQVKPPWSQDEAKHVLALSRGHHLELPLALATLLGMRRSEILGLQWPDFDFLKGTLTIHRVRRDERMIAENGQVSVSTVTYPPKSASSRRQIPMGSIVQAAVLAHRQRQQERGYFHPVGWVFATRTANPVSPSRLSRVFKGFLRENNIREIRFHDVRHTAVTLSLEAGVRIEVVSQMVGHSRIDTTKSIYAPVVQAINSEYTEKMDDYLGGTSQQVFVVEEVAEDVE
jgi:integrase